MELAKLIILFFGLFLGGIIALALGYRFSVERNAPEFSGDWNEVVRDAAENVKNAVDNKELLILYY